MEDLYLDPDTNDFVFENGDIKWVPTNQELCRQRIVMALKTFKGEWFRDASYGMPYLSNDENSLQLLGNKDKTLFDAELRRTILKDPTAKRITSYKTKFDNESGTLTAEASVLTDFGEIIINTSL